MLISRKNKNLIKKKIKKLKQKKKFNFKLNFFLEYIKSLNILINSKFLIFFQFISLNSIKDYNFFSVLLDSNLSYNYIKKKILYKIFEKKKIKLLKNFNNILSLNTLKEFKNILKILLNKNILILGYYINNIFFYKKDFNLNYLKKNNFILNILNLKNLIYLIFKKIIFLLKFYLKKIIFIFQKKII